MDSKFLHLAVVLALLALVTLSSTQTHNKECRSISDCSSDSTFMECVLRYEPGQTGNCRCRDGTVYNGTACVAQADRECMGIHPSRCVDGATCQAGKCECRLGYSAKPISALNELFCRGTYGSECPIGGLDDCDTLNGLRCTSDVDPENPGRRECRCNSNMAWNSNRQQCLFLHDNGPCFEDDECIDNAICSGSGWCACSDEFGFEYTTTAQQCRRKFGQNCTATDECNTDKRMVCSTGKCACANNEVYDGSKCRKLAGGTCETDGDCGGGTKCHKDGFCFCDRSDNMVELVDKRCGRMTGQLNGYCESTGNCGVGNYLNCTKVGTATVGQCLCQSSMQYIQGEGCRHLAGEVCSVNHGCVLNAACIDKRCVCKNGFTRTSDDKCLMKEGERCSYSVECNHEGGLICLGSGQCGCPTGQEWSDEQSHCVALVSGNCTETNELCTSNAHCSSRGVCECDQGYSVLRGTYPDRYRSCVPTYNATCNATASVPCNDEEFLTCDPVSNTCKCLYPLQQAWDSSIKACASLPSGFCGTLPELGGREMRCLGSSTCHTEAEADVIGRCKCNSGFSVSENENICMRTSGALGSMSGISMTSLMSFLGLYVFMGKFAV